MLRMFGQILILVLGTSSLFADDSLPSKDVENSNNTSQDQEISKQIAVLQKNSNWGYSQEAGEAVKRLVAIGKPAVPSISPLLESEKWMNRYRAGLILARIGVDAKSAIPVMKRSIKNEQHSLVSRRAPLFLASMESGPKGIIAFIKKKKGQFEITDNVFAAYLLGKSKEDAHDALPVLKELLEKVKNEKHRSTIETAIKQINKRSKKPIKESDKGS